MKKLILFTLVALAFAIPQDAFAQGSCSFVASVYEAEPCCISINAGCGDPEAWHVVVTNPNGTTQTYTSADYVAGIWFPHCGEPGDYIVEFFVFNNLWWTRNVTLTEEDCEDTQECITTDITCPEGGNLGSYTLCCDGSLTVNSTTTATYVKIYNIPGLECDNQDGQVNGSACTLCGLWGGNSPCGGSWAFPAGTVTESNQIWLEFQSNSPWHEFDCDWTGTGIINLSNELAEMNCESGFVDGGSSKNGTATHTSIAAEISLSPNPASSFVNIINPNAKNLSVEIYNTSGKHLRSQSVNQTLTTIDLSTLTQGLYLVHLKDTETQKYISIEKLFITK